MRRNNGNSTGNSKSLIVSGFFTNSERLNLSDNNRNSNSKTSSRLLTQPDLDRNQKEITSVAAVLVAVPALSPPIAALKIEAYVTFDPEDSLFPAKSHAFYNPYSRADAENDSEAQDSSSTTAAPDLQSKDPSISSLDGSFRPGTNQFAALRSLPVPTEISMPPRVGTKQPNTALDDQIRKEEAARDVWRRHDLNTVKHLRRIIHLRDRTACDIDFSLAALYQSVVEYKQVQHTYAEAGLPAETYGTWLSKVKKTRKEQIQRHFATDFGRCATVSTATAEYKESPDELTAA